MAENSTYKVIELIGTSDTSWEDAARHAVEQASAHLKGLRIAEIKDLDLKVDETTGKVVAYRAKVHVSFKYSP